MTIAQRNIRLTGRIAPGLDRISGESGEIYYDTTSDTLRVYTGRSLGGTRLATEPFVNTSITTALIPYARSTALIGLATETFVNSAVSTAVTNLIDAAPGALNTLNELAAAINNDASYAGTITSALALKAPLASPALTGTPTAPTATAGTNTTQIATTEFVSTAVSNLIDAAPGALNTLNELAAAINDDASYATTVTNALALKAPLASPAFTGTVTGITATMVGLGNVTNESKSTMFNNPEFTGTVTGVSALMVGLGNVTDESKATMFTSPTFTGTTTIQQTTDVVVKMSAATGVVAHDYSQTAVWYHTGVLANFTANFTNIPATDMRGISVTLIIVQGATPYIPNAVQIGGVAQTINWQNGATPPGLANKKDMVNFLLMRINDVWTVTGSLASYG